MTTMTTTPIATTDAVLAQLANSVTGIYGLSGTGKSSHVDEACIYAWEEYQAISRILVSDLGGWGTKRASLIKLGIVQVYFVRNHVRPAETMELVTQGYWPETMLDPMTGLADPDVVLVPPRQSRFIVYCQQGHAVTQLTNQLHVQSLSIVCPTCGTPTTASNVSRIEQVTVKSKGFAKVGHWGFDSISQLCDWGLGHLADMSAHGKLGDALSSADALVEGTIKLGTNSPAQYGTIQNRAYVWLKNIRSIPDQVIPATATFSVELAKPSEETGHVLAYGPKIAGNARTAQVPGWLGNCLHATREPDQEAIMRHRLWLVNHVDPRDTSGTPYLSKHRGEPDGMPPFLEDVERAENGSVIKVLPPWEQCSLRRLYKLLDEQTVRIGVRDRERFANAPALQAAVDDSEQVIATAAPVVAEEPIKGQLAVSREIRRSGRRVAAVMPSPAAVPAMPATQPVATEPAATGDVVAPAPTASQDVASGRPAVPSAPDTPADVPAAQTAPVSTVAPPPTQVPASVTPIATGTAQTAPPPAASVTPAPVSRFRRTPRPPV